GGVGFRTLHHGFDKCHAADAVFDLGVIVGGIIFRELALVETGADGVGEVLVNVGKRFEVALGMRRGSARGGGGVLAEVTVGGAINLHGLIQPFDEQGVGFA